MIDKFLRAENFINVPTPQKYLVLPRRKRKFFAGREAKEK